MIRVAVQRKLAFLTDMSVKALSPPPLCPNRHMNKNVTDDFFYKKNPGCEGKILSIRTFQYFKFSRHAKIVSFFSPKTFKKGQ